MASIAKQRDQLWQVDGLGFPGAYFFFGKTGGDTEQTHSKEYDGGQPVPEITVDDATTSDIVLQMKYRAADHQSVCRSLRDRLKRREYIPATLKGFDCDAQKTPIGQVDTIPAVLMKITWPESAADSTTSALVTLTFSVP